MPKENLALKYPQYHKSVAHLDSIDVYTVHQLFGLNDPSGALQHASKKLLLAGQRNGAKPMLKDIEEARDTLTRYLDLNAPTPTPAYGIAGFGITEAANDPAPAVKLSLVPKEPAAPLKRYVILYYLDTDNRRLKPRQHFSEAVNFLAAKQAFMSVFPYTEIVCGGEVTLFISGADALSRLYWASR